MRKNTALRRSRSWRDLSEAVSRRLFKSDTRDTPKIPLHRSCSLDRLAKDVRTPSMMFQDYEGDYFDHHLPTVDYKRAKERTFQQQTTVKRKAIPKRRSGRGTTFLSTATTRITPTKPVTNPSLRHSQLPAFTFSSTALETSPVDDLEILPTPITSSRAQSPVGTPSIKSRRGSRRLSAITTHSHMPSEMSIPMVLDFDLALHQDSRKFSADGILNVGAINTMERTLSSEEKAELLSSIPPMHIINFTRPEPKARKGALKRLFSLKRTEKKPKFVSQEEQHRPQLPPSPPKSSISTIKNSPKQRQSPQIITPPRESPQTHFHPITNFVQSESKTLYSRPAPPSPPLSPTDSSIKKDSPPRLTVQIPDSNLDRASKLFQSIYLASEESWEFPSPASSSIRSDLTKQDPPPIPPKSRGKPRGVWNLLPSSESVSKTGSPEDSPSAETTAPLRIRRTAPVIPMPESLVAASKRHSRTFSGVRGRQVAFPVRKHPHRFSGAVLDLSEDDSGSDGDDEEEIWDGETLRSADGTGKGSTIFKEPVWEMITPPNKV